MDRTVSIIVPENHIDQAILLPQILESFQEQKDQLEVIVVYRAGGDLVKRYNWVVWLKHDTNSRGARLKLGMEHSKAPMILFHHPRSLLGENAINWLKKESKSLLWGGFSHQFDHQHPLLSFTSWYSNHIRGDIKGIYYLDHCLFVSRRLLTQIREFPCGEIFEDTELCLQLNQIKRPIRLPFISQTSWVRFEHNGIINQIWLNIKMKWQYYLKVNPGNMNQEYEASLSLNSEYP
jgi:hypothetical protein